MRGSRVQNRNMEEGGIMFLPLTIMRIRDIILMKFGRNEKLPKNIEVYKLK